ncbi:hypothetical protein HZZ09_16205 [Acinetobacter nosocomialis]|uniref:hypothetical protein n=1 Tax=Acinetobacter nosocomialis TaxID=106654 RepID=UPI00385780BB|nr:hypothetical protein [Acinetobacter nosocomialis]
MDKCREEFEEYFKEHHADSFYSVDVALEMRGDDYIDFLASDLWAIWQHQQAKVEELKASHHGEVIGHEVHFKKIKQERDELQTLYTQQGINMLKLQKRVDQQGLIIAKAMSIASDLQKSWSMFEIGKKLEQAIKGEGQ